MSVISASRRGHGRAREGSVMIPPNGRALASANSRRAETRPGCFSAVSSLPASPPRASFCVLLFRDIGGSSQRNATLHFCYGASIRIAAAAAADAASG